MIYTIRKTGFTLIEILVAVALSGIIAAGIFELFNTITNSKIFLANQNSNTQKMTKLILLMDKDIRCKIGNFHTESSFGIKKLSFETTNSLKYAGSVPVNVSYYVKDGVLYREEINSNAKEDMTIPLTTIKNFVFKFYLNGIWTSVPTPIIKITLIDKNGHKYTFTARGMIE